MSVEDTNKIDIFSFGKDGVLRLFITDHLPWGDDAHLLTLQEKLNSYIAYVESGQCYEVCPEAVGAPVAIEVVTKFPPDAPAQDFLFKAGEIAATARIALTHRTGP